MATLTFKAGASWFAPNVTTIKRNIITAINIVDSYVVTGNEIDSWDASEDNDGSIMCYVTGAILTIAGNGSGTIKFNADQSYWLYSTDGKDYFKNCTSFTGLSLIDTSNCTTLNRSFRGLEKITSLDIGHFDISNVTSLYQTFCYCKKLTSLPIENWDVSNVTTMAYTFYQIGALTLPIENWNVSNVTNLDHTFAHSASLNNLDLTKWDVSNVTNMNATFCGMKALTSLDLSTWDTSKVTCFPQFVEGCSNLETIYGLENFDTSQSVCFAQMFRGCSKLKELDLSSFDTRNADSGSPTSDNGSTSGCTWQMITNTHSLEKITLGKYFTFEGKGIDIVPAEDIGTLPTPSATYIEGADGNWYTEDFTAYAPADVPNLTEMTYYASKKVVNDVIDTRVLNFKGLKHVLASLNTVINDGLNKIDLSGLETKTDAQAKLDEAKEYADTAVANLVNSAPETLDTLGELATAFEENAEVVDALNEAIVNKADVEHAHSWDELEDKPFGEVEEYEEIFNDSVYSYVHSDTDIPYCQWTNMPEDILIVGDTYRVTYEGVQYVVTCKYTGADYPYLGNAKITASDDVNVIDTGEPFFIVYMGTGFKENLGGEFADGRFRWYHPSTVSGGSTGIIEHLTTKVKQLDEQYIPNVYARTIDVDTALENKADKGHVHSWNDLEDKPFYAEPAIEDIVPEQDLSFEYNSYFGAFVNMGETVDFALIENETYTVVFDNVEYESIAVPVVFAGMDAIAIGNLSLAGLGNNTGEHFIIASTNTGGQIFATSETAASHKIRIYHDYEQIHTLDKKYLPSDIGMQSSWLQDDESSNDYIKNRTHYSIRENNAIIISETTLLKDSFDKLSGLYASYIDVENTFNISPDSVSCTVVWDGVEYNNVPVYYSSTFATDASVRIGIGDIGEYPFGLHAYLNDDLIGYIGVYTIALSDHTISVIGEAENVVKQLDNKYIKDSIARVDDVKNLISIKSSEIDELLSNKADNEHTHAFDEISGFVELTADDIDAMFAK